MTIEDACVLGSLLSRHDPSNTNTSLPSLLDAYTSIRVGRTEVSVEIEKQTWALMSIPRGSPTAEARDEVYRKADELQRMGGTGEESVEHLVGMWSFDAREEAENWWISWRLPAERSHAASFLESTSRQPNHEKVDVGVQVSVTIESEA
jgi:hypothetical protein